MPKQEQPQRRTLISPAGLCHAWPLTPTTLEPLADLVQELTNDQELTTDDRPTAPDNIPGAALTNTGPDHETAYVPLQDGAHLARNLTTHTFHLIHPHLYKNDYAPHIPDHLHNANGTKPAWRIFTLNDRTTITTLLWDLTTYTNRTTNHLTRIKWDTHPLSPNRLQMMPVEEIAIITTLDLTQDEEDHLTRAPFPGNSTPLPLPRPHRSGISHL